LLTLLKNYYKNKMKKFMPYIPGALIAIIAIVSLGFSESNRKSQTCTGIEVTIDKGNYENRFIDENDVKTTIQKNIDSITTRTIESLDINEIEEKLTDHPSILNCETYTSLNGKLHVEIEQRSPILRVISKTDSYYIDNNGRFMPLSKNYTAHTIVASGNITSGFRKKHNVKLETASDSSCLKDVFEITERILQDKLLNAMIEQIYVNKKGDYLLISKVGPPVIELGSVDDLHKKLKTLRAFYHSKKAREHWNNYSKISIQYKNQIVCTKQ